ncbi:MAG: hypothetical protein WCG47_08475 [Dermatophilaceae bacterium]
MADVLGFITSQRIGQADPHGWHRLTGRDERSGVASSTVARRLSNVSGFFAYLQARGDIAANAVPRGLPAGGNAPVRARACR